jgi:hypothetical protein
MWRRTTPLKNRPEVTGKFRAGRKPGGTIEKPLASLPENSRRTDTGDKIAGPTG